MKQKKKNQKLKEFAINTASGIISGVVSGLITWLLTRYGKPLGAPYHKYNI